MDIPDWASAAAAAAAGLVIGPWLAAVIARVPPRRGADMIPVVGWLRRRRRSDGEDPGYWRLAAELITAAAFAALALRLGLRPVLPAFCYLAAVGVALAIIDIQQQRLPDVLTLTSYPVALILLGLAALAAADGGRHFRDALIGMAATGLFYLLQALIYPAGLGWGDVKLSGLIGLYLGWLGAGVLLAGLLAGYLLAALTGIALLVTRRATRKSHIPFGPFMLAGALIVILASGVVGSHSQRHFPNDLGIPMACASHSWHLIGVTEHRVVVMNVAVSRPVAYTFLIDTGEQRRDGGGGRAWCGQCGAETRPVS
jgi:leader peptidase (prepilin peptidase) / N-methyltransferase